jgi:thioesterase domain-containing protein
MGGIVAFEMANQLAAAGHDVPLVILIDCSVPVPRNAPHSIGNLEAQAGFAADLARIEGGENWASRITGEIGEKRLRRLEDVYRANRLALDGYQPRAYSGRVILVQAEANLNNLDSSSTDGWKALAIGGISTHLLPGDHYTIMQRPTVLRLAEILAAEIERQEQTLKEDPIR